MIENFHQNAGFVIVIDGRFFRSIKNDRVCTAWCIAGAKVYSPFDRREAESDVAELMRRKKKAVLSELMFCEVKESEQPKISESLEGGDTWLPF